MLLRRLPSDAKEQEISGQVPRASWTQTRAPSCTELEQEQEQEQPAVRTDARQGGSRPPRVAAEAEANKEVAGVYQGLGLGLLLAIPMAVGEEEGEEEDEGEEEEEGAQMALSPVGCVSTMQSRRQTQIRGLGRGEAGTTTTTRTSMSSTLTAETQTQTETETERGQKTFGLGVAA